MRRFGFRRIAAAAAAALLATMLLVAAGTGPAGEAVAAARRVPDPTLFRCYRDCFDQYIRDQERCTEIHCTFLFGVRLWCYNSGLRDCLNAAKDIYERCLDACGAVKS
jgi:hypothetical protein